MVKQNEDIKIGTLFVRRGTKRNDVETVIDIYRTYNSKNELVKVRYAAEHPTMGQKVIDHDVCATTILRGLV